MKWEYMIDENIYSHIDLARLNKQGDEGWELCCVWPAEKGGLSILYKRQKPQHV